MGFVSQFIATSVQTGFLFGLGMTIIIGQVIKLLGVPGTSGPFVEQFWYLVRHLDDVNSWTAVLGGAALAAMLLLKRVAPSLPAALLVVIVSIVLVAPFDLEGHGVAIFGAVDGHPEYEQLPGVLVYRVDGEIFYATTESVKDGLTALVDAEQPPAQLVVLDLENTPSLDLAATDMVEQLGDDLAARGAELRLAGATSEVRDTLCRVGLERYVGSHAEARTVEGIVDEWQAERAGATRTTPDSVT